MAALLLLLSCLHAAAELDSAVNRGIALRPAPSVFLAVAQADNNFDALLWEDVAIWCVSF